MPRRKDDNAPYWRKLRATRRAMIMDAIYENGSKTAAAKALGIAISTLVEEAQDLGIGNDVQRSHPIGPVARIRALFQMADKKLIRQDELLMLVRHIVEEES